MGWYYYAGGQRVALRNGTILRFLLGDHLGSTAVTATSTGAKYAEQRYYPWGGTRWPDNPATPTARRFTGQIEDAAVGLYFYNARYYDPYLNRWLQPDTIIPDPANPQSLNRYSYCLNNPLKYVDPTGHREVRYSEGEWIDEWAIGSEFAGEWNPVFTAQESTELLEQIFAAGVDFSPLVGDVKGFIEVFTGKDLITGDSLGIFRWLGVLGISELRYADELVDVADATVPATRIVIGEGMDAIKAAARKYDAKWYQAWTKYFSPEMVDMEKSLARNERWLRSKIRQGFEILDIGIDPSRATRSPFYALEKRILEELGYPVSPIPRP